MKNYKRVGRISIIPAVAIILSLVILTGCGSQSANSVPPATQETPPVEVVTIALDGFPQPMSHTLEGREQCLDCHQAGKVGQPPHEELTNCRMCHVSPEASK